MTVKSELQGGNGLLKKLRDECIPQGQLIAHEAIGNLNLNADNITKEKARENFNDLLYKVLLEEWKVYQSYETALYKTKVIPEIIKLIRSNKRAYPKCQFLIKTALDEIQGQDSPDDKMLKITQSFYEYFEALFQSLHQSRKTRAGGSLQYQIEHIFNLCGFPFQKQTFLNGPVDFLIPSEEYFHRYRHDAIILSLKRTLRERWQQAIAELHAARVGRIYLATAETDKGKIRNRDLDRMDNLNVTLVVFDRMKIEKFPERPTVIGYTEFINTNIAVAEQLWIQRGIVQTRR
jgi:hypothetical protein